MTFYLISLFIYLEDIDICEKYDFTTAASGEDNDEENIPKSKTTRKNNFGLQSGRLFIYNIWM